MLNILLAAHIFYFSVLVFHVFVLAQGIRKRMFSRKRLFKKMLPEAVSLQKNVFLTKIYNYGFRMKLVSASKVLYPGYGRIQAVARVPFVKQIISGHIYLAQSVRLRATVMAGVCLMPIPGL